MKEKLKVIYFDEYLNKEDQIETHDLKKAINILEIISKLKWKGRLEENGRIIAVA